MLELTAENFNTEVENYKGLIAIDLWASWCGPCKMLAPIFEELSREMPDVKFCKINVDDQLVLAMLFKVESIPMIALVKDNTFIDMTVGYVPKERLAAFINGYRESK